jgi:polyhydroxybutyrate depolymerase
VNDITEMIEVWLFLRKWDHSNPTTLGLENKELSMVKISPNPSNGLIRITGEYTGKIRLVDLRGAVVFEQQIQAGSSELDLNALNKGVYVMQVGEEMQKLVLN